MSKTKVICFANNKGGSGKSTTCSNVGYNLAQMGKRVLLIDGDMQLNLTLSFLPEDQALGFVQSGNNLYTAIKEQRSLQDYIVKTPYEGVDIVPSSTLMSSIEYELFTKWQREFILRKCLEPVKATGVYDYVLIDGDMQLNLTLSFFPEDVALGFVQSGNNLYTAIKEQKSLQDYIVKPPYEGVHIVPSSTLMSSIEYELFTKWQREFILRKCLEPVKATGVYDYVLIDSPPTLGGWVMNIMCASDYLVVPVEASPWGLFGLANMFDFVGQVKQIAPTLSVLGIAITKADERKNYFHQTVEALRGYENIKLFESYIRIDSSIEWAQDNSKPVGAYKKSSRSAKEYYDLTKEILEYADR